MDHIACISYGKDSLAMLEIIHQHNLPLDRIVHVEIMATDTIPADLPELADWKRYADEIILDRYGVRVEHLRAEKTYEELFYRIPTRTEKNKHLEGRIQGFPSLRGQWCSRDLKVRIMQKLKDDSIQYIGIAIDETGRHSQLSDKLRSPLVEYEVTEDECLAICESIGLLAPTYLQSKRSGCWFCHAQPIHQLRLLRQQHPDLWDKLLAFDKDSPMPFRHDKNGPRSVREFDERFSLEDKGVLKAGCRRFKWAKMPEYRAAAARPRPIE